MLTKFRCESAVLQVNGDATGTSGDVKGGDVKRLRPP
jgi:hypothetical protein